MKNLQTKELSSDDLWSIAKDCSQGDFLKTYSIMKDLGSPEPVLVWKPSVDFLDNPLLKNALEWWEETRIGRLFPKPGDVDPASLKSLLGRITLYDVINEGEDFKCRLYGSNLVPEIGKDCTGLMLSEIWTPIRTFFIINNRSILIRKEPLYTIHQPHHSLNLSRWERLILPLGTTEKVERLLTVLISSPRKAEAI